MHGRVSGNTSNTFYLLAEKAPNTHASQRTIQYKTNCNQKMIANSLNDHKYGWNIKSFNDVSSTTCLNNIDEKICLSTHKSDNRDKIIIENTKSLDESLHDDDLYNHLFNK